MNFDLSIFDKLNENLTSVAEILLIKYKPSSNIDDFMTSVSVKPRSDSSGSSSMNISTSGL